MTKLALKYIDTVKIISQGSKVLSRLTTRDLGRCLRDYLIDYLRFPLNDVNKQFEQRLLVYLFHSLMVCAATFLSLRAYEVWTGEVGWLPFQGVYAWHTTVNFSLCFVVVFEMSRYIRPQKGEHRSLRTYQFWLVGLIAFFIAFFLQRTVVYSRIDTYYPSLILFYEKYPFARPSIAQMFVWCFMFWLPVSLILVHFSRILQKKYSQNQTTSQKTQNRRWFLQDGKTAIDISELTHLSMEDHYARIYWQEKGEMHQVLVRLTLKEALKHLTDKCFVQVHRSHVVNLNHVKSIQKDGNRWVAVIGHHKIPISRSRLTSFKNQLLQNNTLQTN